MKGAMKLADPQPSIGPCVNPRMKQISAPVIKSTPIMSILLQRGIGFSSEAYEDGELGRSHQAKTENAMQMMARTRKNLLAGLFSASKNYEGPQQPYQR